MRANYINSNGQLIMNRIFHFQKMKIIYYYQLVASKKIFGFILISVIIYLFYKINQSQYNYEVMNENVLDWKHYLLEEINFPIAFGISVYRDPEQFEHLFKAIYRPFNVYCIHVDLKSNNEVHEVAQKLKRKFRNVIFPKKFINVEHAKFSVLESELLCMEALYKYKKINWKYFINLTGQEWPLKVNLEIVRILKSLNGANLVEKININQDRIPSDIGSPPHKVKLWKGAVHIIVVKDFVRFALTDKRALDVLDYLRKTLVPDETYFSTLNHDHTFKAPGGYSGDFTRDDIKYPFLNRHKLWIGESTCHGKFVRGICIFSMADVPQMIDIKNKKFFANKFIMGINSNVYNFMENWFYNRSRVVYSNPRINPFINLTYYSQLEVTRNHY